MSGIEDDGNIKPEWSISYYDLEFGDLIGSGNFGEVYRGEYCGTEVAIKKILPVDDDEENEKYTAREISMLTGVRHPNVVNFMGVAKRVKHGQEFFYIVTEWLPGNTLRKLMKDTKIVVGWRRRIELARDAALAMCYLHKKNIIHRDLKSANLMIAADGSLKVCDFGLARKVTSRKAGAYTMAGTEEWMAPEVIVGDEYDEKCDVFSYGAVLYELMTRQKPPARGPAKGYEFNFSPWSRVIPPECPKTFSKLAMRCLEYNGKNRPSFNEIIRVIKELLSGTEIPPDTPDTTPLNLTPRSMNQQERNQENVSAFKRKLFEAMKDDKAGGAAAPATTTPARDPVAEALRENTERLEEMKREQERAAKASAGKSNEALNDSGKTATKKKKKKTTKHSDNDKPEKPKKPKKEKKEKKKKRDDSSDNVSTTADKKKGKSAAVPSSAKDGDKLRSKSTKSKDAGVIKKTAK